MNTVGVYSAPTNTPYERLPKIAQRRGEVRSAPKVEPKGILPAHLWPLTSVGEVYKGQHSLGKVTLPGTHRAQTRTLKPADGTIEVDLAPVWTGKDMADDLTALHDRVTQLAQRAQPTDRIYASPTATFSQPGNVFESLSGEYLHPNPAQVVEVSVGLGTPASEDTTIQLVAEGVPGPSVILPAGQSRTTGYFQPVQLASPGRLAVAVTGGADGAQLTVVATLREQRR